MIKRTVLIADGQNINRVILGRILENEYSLLYASNGSEALNIMKEKSGIISAALLDAQLPETDGYAVLCEMRKNGLLDKIPVIVCSRQSDDQTEIKSLSLGARDFIAKPCKPDIIRCRLANTIALCETEAAVNTLQRDEITGLFNKQYFLQAVEETVKKNPDKKYDIICIDIDRFKLINDILGINAGNSLLRLIAQIMLEHASPLSGICARFMADMFFMLIPRRENYSEEHFAEYNRLCNEKSGLDINIKLRYGIYSIRNFKIPVSIMCDRAKLATEEIKGKYDRCMCHYNDKIRQKLLQEQMITDCMKRALEDGQFSVYYQPKYELATETLAGAEALVRWIHPDNGVIMPGEFIPLFEKNGFIMQLDMFVLETVCRDLRKWISEKNKPVAVSVNISRADINNPHLSQILTELVNKYEIPKKYLHLEITETAYTENPQQIIEVIRALRSQGFVVEMDDFGSGYSSLNMLSKMPIDILKLDMKFIQSQTDKPYGRGILNFIISLAKWLDLAVIAEGVETKEQISALRTMDCNYVQGYYYAKPMPAPDFRRLLYKSEVADMICKSSATQLLPATQLDLSEKSGRVMLIVDDTESDRAVLADAFSGSYVTVQAENGEIAWDYIVHHFSEIDVIMIDLMMPVMNGFQLLEKLRADKRTRALPIIVMSRNDKSSEKRVLDMGADDFVIKPFDTDILKHRVKNAVIHSKLRISAREYRLTRRLKEIEYKANYDSLTHLYNRSAFENFVSEYLRSPNIKKSVFITLDIDNFKLINDTFGHIKGDETLKNVALILKSCFRDSDIIARMGGDEFAVFVSANAEESELKNRLSTLCRRMNFDIDGIETTCSVGACVSPDFGLDYQTLYNNADIALMTAKRCGKNQYQIFGGQTVLPPEILLRNMDWLLDESTDAVVVCDAESYSVLYLNEVACKIAGKNKRDCIGKCCYEVLWNKTSPCADCAHVCAEDGSFTEYETVPENCNRSFIIKTKLLEWSGRKVRIQYMQDNTEKSRMMHELASVSHDRKRILDLLPGGLFRYAAQGDGIFDFISKNMLKMLGYTKAEFVKKFDNKFENMVWHADRQRVLDEINAQIANSDMDQCDYRIEKGDGTLCWVHDVGHLITDDDGKKWFYVTIVDITAQKDALPDE